MQDTQPLTSEVRQDPHQRLEARLRSLLLPLLSAFLCVIVLTQAASFFFLFGRLEAVRGRLEAVEGERLEFSIAREVELLKSRVQVLVEDHTFTHASSTAHAHHYLHPRPHHSPPAPRPPAPGPPSEPSKDRASQAHDRNGRVKRLASDPSYGVNGALGEGVGENGELSVQLQGEESREGGEAGKSWLQLTSYARIPVSTPSTPPV